MRTIRWPATIPRWRSPWYEASGRSGDRVTGRYHDGVNIALGIVYVLIGLVTVTLVLLHSGRGGGLSDMFGGGLGAAAAGSTSIERNLDRLTVLMSLIFAFMTLILAFRFSG